MGSCQVLQVKRPKVGSVNSAVCRELGTSRLFSAGLDEISAMRRWLLNCYYSLRCSPLKRIRTWGLDSCSETHRYAPARMHNFARFVGCASYACELRAGACYPYREPRSGRLP